MYCSKCGNQINGSASFCPECGTKINRDYQVGLNNQQQSPDTINETNLQKQNVTSTPVKKQKSHGCLLTFISFILTGTILFTGYVQPGFVKEIMRRLTPMPDYFKNGAEVTKAVSDSEDITIGTADETGYILSVPAGSFPTDSSVGLHVLSKEENKKFDKKGKFAQIGTAVELSCEQYDGGLFESEVELEVTIPERQLDNNASACDFSVMYYDESSGEWVSFPIDWYDSENGVLHATIPHFSIWTFGKPSREEQLETFLDNYSREAARKQYDDEQVAKSLVPYVSESLKNVDMTKEQRGELARSLAVYVASQFDGEGKDTKQTSAKFVCAAWKAAETGDSSEFTNVVGDTVAEKLTDYFLKSGEYVPEYAPGITKVVGSVSGLSKAAGYLAGGDYDGATHEIAGLLASATPTTALINAAANYAIQKGKECYNDWKGNQIEELYQIYKNGLDDFYGNHVSPNNEEELWEYINYPHGFTKVAGVYRIYHMDGIAATCAKYGWSETDYKKLSPEKKDIFENRAKDGLMDYFKTRLEQEKVAETIKKQERQFINELDRKTNLLASFKFKNYFGEESLHDYNVSSRLAKIYEIRNLIPAFIDEDKFEKSGKKWCYFVEKWVSVFDEYNESTAMAKYLEFLKDEKVLKKEFAVSDEDNTLEAIAGYWMLNAKMSDMQSSFVDWLVNILGDAVTKYYDENSVFDIAYSMEIKPMGDNKAEVSLYSEYEDGTYVYTIYDGTYKDGNLSLKVKEKNGTYEGEELINKVKLSFAKNGDVYMCSGEYDYRSFMLNCHVNLSGRKTEPLE